jgi:predicted Fe-Mo cluster-binding NifX family protein
VRSYAIFEWNENGSVRFLEMRPNPYEKTLQRGKTFDVMHVLSDCGVFICWHVGKKGVARIQDAGIDLFMTPIESVEEALHAYLRKNGGKGGEE